MDTDKLTFTEALHVNSFRKEGNFLKILREVTESKTMTGGKTAQRFTQETTSSKEAGGKNDAKQ